MFKQIHMVHKPDDDTDMYNTSYAYNTGNFSPSLSTQAHPVAKTQTYRPLTKSTSDNSTEAFKVSSPPPPPVPPIRPWQRSASEKNEWEPPDRKVDTRKFRSEPRSILNMSPESLQSLNMKGRPLYTTVQQTEGWTDLLVLQVLRVTTEKEGSQSLQ